MRFIDGQIEWAPRVPPALIRRLYQSEAAGRLGEELVDEVAFAFYVRCEDILAVTAAHAGRAPCLNCGGIIVHDWDRDTPLSSDCGWSLTWGDYFRSYQGRQLHGGGSVPWLEDYVRRFPAAKTARERLLLIDRLLHQYHWGMTHPGRGENGKPDHATRPTATNLIQTSMTGAISLLDEIASMGAPAGADPAVRESFEQNRRSSPWTRRRGEPDSAD